MTYCMCALNGTMDLLGRKWVLFAINSIGNHGSVRFTDLNRELRGVSPSTLAWILKQLEQIGVIKRKSFAEIPPRVEYSLTSNGKDLRTAIIPLLLWAARQDDYPMKVEGCEPCQYVQVSGGGRGLTP
ncbi:MAG: helix-turn-helix transcriptional regulator [Nitrososphaerota archaeon]|nr:helix-turn-helix transcriptional regulator [Nitrososphaerota archaeon]MDG7025911.1 helix-turn-helix transcriptional regulator [Nitrososphaerota archaeon]